MNKIDEIIEKLQEQGYNAIAHDVTKNGVLKHGISIREHNISPCIYVDEILKDNPDIPMDELVERIISIYETHKTVDIDLNEILSYDYVLSHLSIALQHASDETLIKRGCDDFPDLEQYLYIRGQSPKCGSWSIKLNESILDRAELTVDEAWSAAESNTFANGKTIIQSMADVMHEILGMEEDELFDEDQIPMYVVSNAEKNHGSVQILDTSAIKAFAQKHNAQKLIVLPSSLHEMIIVLPAAGDELELDRFELMIAEVNATQVAPEEQLSNRAYILHVEAA